MKLINCVLNLLFPPICGICLKTSKTFICENCRELVNLKLLNKIDTYSNKYFDNHLYIFEYEGIIRQRMLEYKFKNKAFIHSFFTEAVLNSKDNIQFIKQYDFIIPVPIHKNRKKERGGYNQSELIAKDISLLLPSIKLVNKVLIKSKNAVAQSTLNRTQRQINVNNVYKITNKEKICNKNILIIDDIYTTGSTVNECAKVLKKAGASNLGILTICKSFEA